MDARVIFTKKTKEKMEKGSTHYNTGILRFNKLKELENNGGLAFCKNRLDICECLGFERRIGGTGYNWISAQIRKGYLSEILLQFDKQNMGEYEYHLTGLEPNYSGNKHIQERVILKPEISKVESKLTLIYGDIRIDKENLSKNFVLNIINNLGKEI